MKGGRKDEEDHNSLIGFDGYLLGCRNSLGPCKLPFLWVLSISVGSSGACPCLFLPSILPTLSLLWLSGLGSGSLELEMDIPWLGEGLGAWLLAL